MVINRENLTKLSNDYIQGLAILSRMKEEGASPHDYLQHSIKFFIFKEFANNLLKQYEKGEENGSQEKLS